MIGFLACFQHATPTLTVFPEGRSSHNWSLISWHDQYSVINYEKSASSINAEFKLSSVSERPNAAIAVNFDKSTNKLVDLSSFNKARVLLKCSSANTLYFGLSFQDEKVTQENNPITYRSAGVFFDCDTEWREVIIKLDSLEVPVWWLHMFGFKASENKFNLNKTIRVYFETTYESPLDVDSRLYISGISFSGQKEGVLLAFTLITFLVWVICGAWTIKFYFSDKSREKEITQEFKYEQLTFNSARERDKQAIIEYISKNFANPEIDNESVSKVAGVSRTRVNEILKAEYGSSFTNYINKLRLVEASRLLTEKPDAHVTEIAYLVGFKNISYFNKLFKEQFGLTPKEIRGKGAQT